MTLKENNRMTDLAWDKLYNRLEQDGLIQEGNNRKTVYMRPWFRWTAGAAVLLLCIASVFFIRNQGSVNTHMLTMNNTENTTTLVSTLEDGSVVYLSEHTFLQYPDRFPEDKREVFLQGDAFFDISKNRERPFIIDTKQAVIQVLGTSFSVKSNDHSNFSLSVKSGEVKVTSKEHGKTVFVKAGETAIFQSNILRTIQTSDMNFFDEYSRRMHFKDQRLVDVIRIINMNTDSVRLKVIPDLENRLLTVTFSDDTPDTMAQLICMALDLNYSRQENMITISGKK